MSLRDEYVAAIEAENERLRERIVHLEEALGIRIEVPFQLGLTGAEAKIFGAMLKRELLTKEQAMLVLYSDLPAADEREIKIVDVLICKMRKKIARFDMEIETLWGRGYRMPLASRATANALLEQARIA